MSGAHIIVPGRTHNIQVRQEDKQVLLVLDGKGILIPWEHALTIGRALMESARKAEEIVKADQIIEDQAILMRLGANINLATRPEMVRIAGNKAAWDSPLRRYIRRSRLNERGKVFAPMVIRHKPARG